jgi:polyphosphate kinase
VAAGIAQTETRFLNRELSQLDFNGRLLEVVEDDSVPLLDRVNFCSIFSSNMDEFFMVRVAGLMDQVAAGVTRRRSDGYLGACAGEEGQRHAEPRQRAGGVARPR